MTNRAMFRACGLRGDGGFTLLEALVSSLILVIILSILWSLLSVVQRSFRMTVGHLDAFETARSAFDQIGRTASQATLMAYFSPDDPAAPRGYLLKSDLHYLSGPQTQIGLTGAAAVNSQGLFFQAPLGVSESADLKQANLLLTSTGFFIRYDDDPMRPAILTGRIPSRFRYRLYQWIQPREQSRLYDYTLQLRDGVIVSDHAYSGTDWFASEANAGLRIRPLADNVVLMVARPMVQGAPAGRYLWNSRSPVIPALQHQMPDSLELALVVIDEVSAQQGGNPVIPPVYIPQDLFADPAEFEADLRAVEQHLSNGFVPAVRYRIFRSTIPLNAAAPNQ